MGRRFVIKDLPENELTLVIDGITGLGEFKAIGALTDREICAAYQTKFNKKLSKSSLARWRKAAGDEIADKMTLVRRQARQLLEDLGEEENADKFQLIISNLEDRLLTATREVIAADPVQMLKIRQEEEKRRLKSRELDIKERQLEHDLSQSKAVNVTPSWILGEFLAFVADDPTGLIFFKKNAKQLEQHLSERLGTVGADA